MGAGRAGGHKHQFWPFDLGVLTEFYRPFWRCRLQDMRNLPGNAASRRQNDLAPIAAPRRPRLSVLAGWALVEPKVAVDDPRWPTLRWGAVQPKRPKYSSDQRRRSHDFAIFRMKLRSASLAPDDVDLENAGQKSRPGHSLDARSTRQGDEPLLDMGLEDDLATPFAVRRQNAEVTG